MPWYKDIELLRAYMRGLIVIVFMAGLGYILIAHIGSGEQKLNPNTVWSWFTGVVTGTLIIYYFGEKNTSKQEE